MTATDFDEIRDTFEFLEDWEERYRYVIEMGKAMPGLDPAFQVPATKVDGCASQVWILPEIEGTGVGHLLVGLIKAPAFALIIGVVGCHAGMQVKGNAESLGRMTSGAVVAAIFAVILADALFSVFFAKVGL